MQYITDEIFHFLELSPYFYGKRHSFNSRISDNEELSSNQEIDSVAFTFTDQLETSQIICELTIPVRDPQKEIQWKLIELQEGRGKPLFQKPNPDLYTIPIWFRELLKESQRTYESKMVLFKIFS